MTTEVFTPQIGCKCILLSADKVELTYRHHFVGFVVEKLVPGPLPIHHLPVTRYFGFPQSLPFHWWILRTCPDLPWGPPSILYNGYRVFPGSKERPGRDANPSPTFSAVGHEKVELYLYSPLDRTACTEPQCLYSRAIPLLPLWTVRPVQSLSACTRVTFTFFMYADCV
jgi:hypothetical protein